MNWRKRERQRQRQIDRQTDRRFKLERSYPKFDTLTARTRSFFFLRDKLMIFIRK